MKRILVADDSVTIQKVIALTFADEPFEVQSVGTGAEALELVKSWKPDIVLADVIMPQMNGYELCRAVKQLEETSAVPVLLLAGTFEAFDEDEAKTAGASDFITKPFESGELIAKVKTLIGGVPETSPAAAPAATIAEVAADPGAPAEAAPQAVPEAPPPPVPVEASEPDIWDLLSDAGDDGQATDGGSLPPGFGPIEDTGVVDVGSFDVGLDRPESPPPAPQPPAAAPPEAVQTPEVVEVVQVSQEQAPQAVPPTVVQVADIEERSRVENMEKDFFGFETGGVEEIPAVDFPDDAVEEVTFEMEQPFAAQEADPQEVSFVVPEPAGDQAAITGETLSPEFMALDPFSPPDPEPVYSPEPVPVSSPEPVAEPAPEPVPMPVFEPAEAFLEVPGFAPDPAPPVDIPVQPVPEPAFELQVDLTPELPAEFLPDPVAEPVVEPPVQATPEPMPVAPSQDGSSTLDDAAMRKIIEEKVEKIAWEVVPEMAEVIIREVIQKIKDGS